MEQSANLPAATPKQRLAALSPDKLAALQKRLQQQKRTGYEPIRALPDKAVYPLSLHQQRLWFIEQLQPGLPTYNSTRAIRLKGCLDPEALESALQSLIDRHEALRTTFDTRDDEPVQRIRPPSKLEVPVFELRESDAEVESTLQKRLTVEGRRIFDLSAGPLIRGILYRLSGDEHVLQITIHHLVCDGWSFGILFRELGILYRGFCTGQAAKLPPMPVRYVDFAHWQRQPRQEQLFTERVKWWKEHLAGAHTVLALPTDRSRPKLESGAGAILPFDIPTGLPDRLDELGQKEQATRYMVLLAGFMILLHRYTGMKDFLVGTASAGRHRPETHDIVGFFVDTLVLRADCTGNPTVREFLGRVRRTVIETVEHGDVPFERVVASLDLPRDLGRHPLVQTLFNTPPPHPLSLDGLEASPVHVDIGVSHLDLEMTYAEGMNRTTGITWNTVLFDTDTIRRMLGHYRVLLEAMVEYPDRAVGELPLLTETERCRILVEWNDTKTPYPADKCVHELFEEQAAKTPDAVAVIFQDEEVSYGELNRRANRLAHRLRALGVGPEVLVGLFVERSVEMVVGILAILKAGGAYVPLDPEYPQERLIFMTGDAGVAVLVCHGETRERLPECAARILDIDAEATILGRKNADNPTPLAGPDNLAYVIYTSGSAGKPKGVMVEHRGLCNLVYAYVQLFPLTPEDRVLQLASFGFDVSMQQIFRTFLGGATLIPRGPEMWDAEQCLRQIRQRNITVAGFTPVHLHQFLELCLENENTSCPLSLRQLTTGGEALSDATCGLCERLSVPLVNSYGSTEATIASTVFYLSQEAYGSHANNIVGRTVVPIGTPIANTQVYILDKYRQPVPIGIPGELYIGGAGVARSYLNRPELTAEKFIPDPFGNEPGARLYRTGDLCRYLPDGKIEFLGRIDTQIKIRGFRVECGEVESALLSHPGVREAVVDARGEGADKQLVAWLVAEQTDPPSVEVLRRALGERLPEYMIPGAFMVLEALPLTPNGKLDRKALPSPELDRTLMGTEFVAPRTPLEEKLVGIWQEVLLLAEPPGIFDNFFDLGGHSLLSARLVSRIEELLEIRLPLRDFFITPTIAGLSEILALPETRSTVPEAPTTPETAFRWQLSEQLDHQLRSYAGSWRGERAFPGALVAGKHTGGARPPLFWVFQGEREFLQMARYLGPDQPLYGMRSGHLVMTYEEDNIQALALRYVEEILALKPQGPLCVGGNCQGALIALAMAQHLLRHQRTVPLLVLMEWSFSLQAYPGPVALLFGEESVVANPHKRGFQHPELAWRRAFASHRVEMIPGEHGRFFDEPNVQGLARTLEQCLSSAVGKAPPILPPEERRAEIKVLEQPAEWSLDTRYLLEINLHHGGTIPWLGAETSGLMLGNRWLDEAGNVINNQDGRTPLPPLAPGEEVGLSLQVHSPAQPGQFDLVIGLVEEGISWIENDTLRISVELAEKHPASYPGKSVTLEKVPGISTKLLKDWWHPISLLFRKALCHKNLQQGNRLRQSGKSESALVCYRRAIEWNPHSSTAWHNRGDCLERLAHWDDAMDAYRRAVDLNPGLAWSHIGLGNAFIQLGRNEEAALAYRQALTISPNLAWVHQRLGDVLSNLGHWRDAERAYCRAAEIDPTLPAIGNALEDARNRVLPAIPAKK